VPNHAAYEQYSWWDAYEAIYGKQDGIDWEKSYPAGMATVATAYNTVMHAMFQVRDVIALELQYTKTHWTGPSAEAFGRIGKTLHEFAAQTGEQMNWPPWHSLLGGAEGSFRWAWNEMHNAQNAGINTSKILTGPTSYIPAGAKWDSEVSAQYARVIVQELVRSYQQLTGMFRDLPLPPDFGEPPSQIAVKDEEKKFQKKVADENKKATDDAKKANADALAEAKKEKADLKAETAKEKAEAKAEAKKEKDEAKAEAKQAADEAKAEQKKEKAEAKAEAKKAQDEAKAEQKKAQDEAKEVQQKQEVEAKKATEEAKKAQDKALSDAKLLPPLVPGLGAGGKPGPPGNGPIRPPPPGSGDGLAPKLPPGTIIRGRDSVPSVGPLPGGQLDGSGPLGGSRSGAAGTGGKPFVRAPLVNPDDPVGFPPPKSLRLGGGTSFDALNPPRLGAGGAVGGIDRPDGPVRTGPSGVAGGAGGGDPLTGPVRPGMAGFGAGPTGYPPPMGGPMGGMGPTGMGQGQQGGERERQTWLLEDDEIWADGDDIGPSVLGRVSHNDEDEEYSPEY
jgi:hypothetical protein